MNAQFITVEIVSKGRKFFKVRYPGKSYEFNLVINEASENFKIGEVIKDLKCKLEYQKNRYGTKITAIPITESMEIEAKNQQRNAEIRRWTEYVESAFKEGRIYENGLSMLSTLGIDAYVKYKKEIVKVKELRKLSQIQKWTDYCRQAAQDGKKYWRGYNVLRELGRGDLVPEFINLAEEIETQREKENSEKMKEEGKINYCFGSPTWLKSEDKTHLQVGDCFKQNGIWYVILTRKIRNVDTDGLSFGLADDSGFFIQGIARQATTEEVNIQEQKEVELQKIREKRNRFNELKKEIENFIRANGSRPPHEASQNRLCDTTNIYGGGNWFEIDEVKQEIWYCINNGMDGDDWEQNNVKTWGAGAIGWCIDFNTDIAEKIQELHKLKAELK